MRTRRGIGAGTAALVLTVITVASVVGVLEVVGHQNAISTSSTGQTSSQISSSVPVGYGTLAPFLGLLSGQDVSCSLSSGVCTVTIENSSTTPMALESCSVTGISNTTVVTTTYTTTSAPTTTYMVIGTTTTTITPTSTITMTSTVTATGPVTTYLNLNGTIGGPAATAGVPANSSAVATCAVPTTQFSSQDVGTLVSGGFTLVAVDSADGYASGTHGGASFQGTWTS